MIRLIPSQVLDIFEIGFIRFNSGWEIESFCGPEVQCVKMGIRH